MIGETVSRYRILERLGGGGMGVVYEAEDLELGRRVALKFLPEALAHSADALARFKREARAASGLNHPHICTIHEIGEDRGRPFIVMERMQGTTLKHAIGGQPMPVDRVLEIGSQLADALAAAHATGIVHRDLKPDNVFVTDHGEAKLLDFGLARQGIAPGADSAGSEVATAQKDYLTSPGTTLGTVAYMSPEQAEGRNLGPASDLFSLGIVLYEMATGRRPFSGDTGASIVASTLRDDPPPMATLAPGVPPALEALIRGCLEKDPQKRRPDAASLKDALRALRVEMLSGPRPKAAPPLARGRLVGGLVITAVALSLVVGWLYQRSMRERWVRREALPQLEAVVDRIQFLQEGGESWQAFRIARQIEAVAPDDPLLARLRPQFTREVSITSDPPGAEVSVRYYDEPEAAPIVLGRTPLQKVAYPRGITRLRLELPGRPPVDDVVWNFSLLGDEWSYRIPAAGEVPEEASLVPAGALDLFITSLDSLKTEPTGAFLVDRHEVTNAEYKRFVEAGGYADPRHWTQPFVWDPLESTCRHASLSIL